MQHVTSLLNEKHEFGHFHILYADLMIEKNNPKEAIQHLYKRLHMYLSSDKCVYPYPLAWLGHMPL